MPRLINHDDDWDDDSEDDYPDFGDDEPMIPCPYCGMDIHDESERCPHCESASCFACTWSIDGTSGGKPVISIQRSEPSCLEQVKTSRGSPDPGSTGRYTACRSALQGGSATDP
jgi:hypothetical protein